MNAYNISKLKLISLVTGVTVILLFSLDQPSWADIIICQPRTPGQCLGTPRDDIIFGWEHVIHGFAGNDYIQTSGSDPNVIFGGDGNDRLIGSSGNDGLYGGPGNDYYDGRSGSDTIFEELIEGESLAFNNEVISGGEGDDYIFSVLGFDRIHGGPGNDVIYPDGSYRDFSFDTVNCGSGTGDRISYNSGDGDTIANCEQINDFDR